jgi:methyl-accepting chemotaxis protein
MFNFGISKRITALAASITIVLVGMLIVSNYFGQSRALMSSQSEQLRSFNEVFWGQVQQDANSLEKLLTVLAQDVALVDLFLQADRNALLDRAKPVFESIRSRYDITHFYFIDLTGKVFLRVHNPQKHGDILKRATYLQARDTGKPGKGIEMGKKYFSLRVVMPVHRNGQLVGYFELGEELDHFIKGFKALTGADISLWLSGDYAAKHNLTRVFQEHSGWYQVMASDVAQQNRLMEQAAAELATAGSAPVAHQEGGSELSIQSFPFKDAFGVDAGIVVIANDVSDIKSGFSALMMKLMGASVVLLVVFIAISMWLSRTITQPLRTANEMLSDIAGGEGDLTRRLEIHSQDEVGELASNFNLFIERLHETISQLAMLAAQVNGSGTQLGVAASNASQIVTQQRSETEQVASAIQEMTATIQDMAGSASAAAESADTADGQASEGGRVVQQAMEAINSMAADVERSSQVISHLKHESQNIGSVLDVIKGIAEQTNLLALNAAIEAARAGEQGRGFAVVADEVRSLAQRTQESTREIEEMIEALQHGAKEAETVMSNSRDRAQGTVEQASNAGSSLAAITSAVASIRDRNVQIATATEEQSAVAEEINRNVINIRDISGLAEQGADEMQQACTELGRYASELNQIVSRFRV